MPESGESNVVVLGASLGGVSAVRRLLAQVPPGFPGVMLVALHRSAFHANHLVDVLRGDSGHDVREPVFPAEAIHPGRVYVAPRDQHMLLDRTHVRVERGAKEHFTRPAADPLFRSAAAAHGARVMGVVLTGGGHDGVGGLIAIKRAGGTSIAQRPSEAPAPSMPHHAIVDDDVDAVLSLDEIATRIATFLRVRSAAA